ncbi:hypothetical protein BD309DRAFT_930352 [Dichomitus squalens]|nr:hypothetical protein BD309DRAFT_930352 [Dichomitus squalens]
MVQLRDEDSGSAQRRLIQLSNALPSFDPGRFVQTSRQDVKPSAHLVVSLLRIPQVIHSSTPKRRTKHCPPDQASGITICSRDVLPVYKDWEEKRSTVLHSAMSIPRFPNRRATYMRPHQWHSAPVVGIRTLPPELILHIFEDVLGPTTFGNIDLDDPDRYGPTRWLPLRRVCRHWRELADKYCPALWQTIDITRKREWMELCLANSKEMGLHLQFPAEYPEGERRNSGGQPRFEPGPEESVVLPLTHAQRIQSVWVSGEKAIEQLGKLRDLFTMPLPRLEELRVTMRAESIVFDGPVLTEILDIDSRRLPALRMLVLDGVYIPWSSGILRNLRALKIVYTASSDPRYCMTLRQFLRALGACQALQYLSIFMSDTWCQENTASPGDAITLPNLRLVEITSLSAQMDAVDELFHVLAHVRFPEHCCINLSTESQTPFRYNQLVPNDVQCFPVLGSATEAVWGGRARFSCRTAPRSGGSTRGELIVNVDCIGDWEFHTNPLITYHDGRPILHPYASMPDTNPEGTLAAFCSYLSRARLTKLTLQYSELISEGAYLSAFRVFPYLVELVLDYRQQQRASSRAEIGRALRALAGQIGPSPGALAARTGEVPLPNLRILRFRDVFWYNELPNHVQQCQWVRQSHGAAPLQVDFGRPRM